MKTEKEIEAERAIAGGGRAGWEAKEEQERNKSPADKEAAQQAADKAAEKTAEKKVTKKRKGRKTNNKAPSDAQFLKALKKLDKAGKTPCTSRALSDTLKIKNADFGRGAARAAMRRLTKDGKAKTETRVEGKVKFHYSPA